MSAINDKEKMQPAPDTSISDLQGLRSLLQFHLAMGITDYPLNGDVQRFLQFTDDSGRQVTRTGRRSGVGQPHPRLHPEAAMQNGQQLLAAMEQDIERCALCPLAVGRLGTVTGRGPVGSSLMVVGDWSRQDKGSTSPIHFGPGEDLMLWKMMEAIGLGSEDVYVTNILKCCPLEGQDIGPECGQNCFSFLVREIALVRPRVICAMGDLAVRMLVGSHEPLFRLRGRFGIYSNKASASIPVMPTFHPKYLLRNPEMKKATWKDLQTIRRRLDNRKQRI